MKKIFALNFVSIAVIISIFGSASVHAGLTDEERFEIRNNILRTLPLWKSLQEDEPTAKPLSESEIESFAHKLLDNSRIGRQSKEKDYQEVVKIINDVRIESHLEQCSPLNNIREEGDTDSFITWKLKSLQPFSKVVVGNGQYCKANQFKSVSDPDYVSNLRRSLPGSFLTISKNDDAEMFNDGREPLQSYFQVYGGRNFFDAEMREVRYEWSVRNRSKSIIESLDSFRKKFHEYTDIPAHHFSQATLDKLKMLDEMNYRFGDNIIDKFEFFVDRNTGKIICKLTIRNYKRGKLDGSLINPMRISLIASGNTFEKAMDRTLDAFIKELLDMSDLGQMEKGVEYISRVVGALSGTLTGTSCGALAVITAVAAPKLKKNDKLLPGPLKKSDAEIASEALEHVQKTHPHLFKKARAENASISIQNSEN